MTDGYDPYDDDGFESIRRADSIRARTPRGDHMTTRGISNERVNTAVARSRKLDRLQAQIEALQKEQVRIAALPQEPTLDGDDTPVIYFRKTFGGTRAYDITAVRCENGLWYCSGSRSPNGATWDQLVDYIGQAEPELPKIIVATEWTEI